MKIKRFFESNSNLNKIEDYFSELLDNDEISKSLNLIVNSITDSYHVVEIRLVSQKLDLKKGSESSKLDRLIFWKKKEIKIYEILKSSIIALENSEFDEIEIDYIYSEDDSNYDSGIIDLIKIEIYSSSSDDEYDQTWIFIDEKGYVKYDKRKLKSLIKDKVGLDVSESEMLWDEGDNCARIDITFGSVFNDRNKKNLIDLMSDSNVGIKSPGQKKFEITKMEIFREHYIGGNTVSLYLVSDYDI